MEHNPTYKHYYELLLSKRFTELRKRPGEAVSWFIPTSDLLLHKHGIEVAAYPVLYPHADFGDTDIKERLTAKYEDWMVGKLPSIQKSFLAKVCSDVRSYQEETSMYAYWFSSITDLCVNI